MATKEEFKEFVTKNPEFAYAVKNGKASWQKLFELYDLYGEDSNVWDEYRKSEVKKETESKSSDDTAKKTASSLLSTAAVKDFLGTLKNIDLDQLQENISGIRKAVSFIEDISTSRDNNKKEEEKKKETQKKKKKGPESIDRFFDD